MEPNIISWMHDGFKRYPDHTTELYQVMSKSQYIYRFHDSAGPRQIGKSSVGASTPELDRQKGYYIVAFVKSLLIDLEALIIRVTGGKQAIAVQPERLNRETRLIVAGCDSLNFANI